MVIHPGYAKCASSWLQENVWNDPRTGLCAPWAEQGPWGAPAPLAETIFVRVEESEFSVESARELLRGGQEEARSRGLVPVLSSEILIDRPNGLGGWGPTVAHRLARTLPEARVVIVIREQRDAIRSSYRHHVETGGRESVRDFIGSGGALVPMRIAHLHYSSMVAAYDRQFGEDRVTVVPFELLRLDPRRFMSETLRAAGVSSDVSHEPQRRASNKGSNAVQLAAQRALNHLAQPRSRNPQPLRWRGAVKLAAEAGKGAPDGVVRVGEERLARTVHQLVGRGFVTSNRQLIGRTGIDLEALGYTV